MMKPAFSVFIGLLMWELIARLIVRNGLLLAPISMVFLSLYHMIMTGEIVKHFYASGSEFLVGFGLAMIAGIAIGFLMGMFKTFQEMLDPWISALFATPTVALMPFYILVFGVYLVSKAALVFTVSVFPIIINTYAGVRSVDEAFIEVPRSFCASRWQTIRRVIAPASLPFIVSGLRLGVGRGLTGVVVAELFFSSSGLGYVISHAGQVFDTANLFAGVVILAAVGVLLTGILARIEKRLAPWKVK